MLFVIPMVLTRQRCTSNHFGIFGNFVFGNFVISYRTHIVKYEKFKALDAIAIII